MRLVEKGTLQKHIIDVMCTIEMSHSSNIQTTSFCILYFKKGNLPSNWKRGGLSLAVSIFNIPKLTFMFDTYINIQISALNDTHLGTYSKILKAIC